MMPAVMFSLLALAISAVFLMIFGYGFWASIGLGYLVAAVLLVSVSYLTYRSQAVVEKQPRQ